MDCFDPNGVLVTREEDFFKNPLKKECNSTIFSIFDISLLDPSIMGSISPDAQINYCDYYEVDVGYKFTQADSGIGLVVLDNRFGGPRDLYYKNFTAD